jgi:hypothetical protein
LVAMDSKLLGLKIIIMFMHEVYKQFPKHPRKKVELGMYPWVSRNW